MGEGGQAAGSCPRKASDLRPRESAAQPSSRRHHRRLPRRVVKRLARWCCPSSSTNNPRSGHARSTRARPTGTCRWGSVSSGTPRANWTMSVSSMLGGWGAWRAECQHPSDTGGTRDTRRTKGRECPVEVGHGQKMLSQRRFESLLPLPVTDLGGEIDHRLEPVGDAARLAPARPARVAATAGVRRGRATTRRRARIRLRPSCRRQPNRETSPRPTPCRAPSAPPVLRRIRPCGPAATDRSSRPTAGRSRSAPGRPLPRS